ncbi:DUF4965 and DUF1793 domain-containing protein [Phanerochaete sordida]|uniref:DUF4965 and DUF1793 domain-containing protein n=1 Tax=Phanerochaete sordida TaxID=48140 RepID=A0A9P3LH69_9APHY|nr:DUF4965 and DUF1793 domain-containing protein [Phanerochaete sordida]
MKTRISAGLWTITMYRHLGVKAQLSETLWAAWAPLAARSPYLNAWTNLNSNPMVNGATPLQQIYPTFFNDSTALMGWSGFIRVDNVTYTWNGGVNGDNSLHATNITNLQITPTRTIMSLAAGPLDLNVTYLSPIEPADPVSQSFPISYFAMTFAANDGQPHRVQVYCDVSGEWLSGDRSHCMDWNMTTDTVVLHQAFLVRPQPFNEINRQAEDAIFYFGALRTELMTWQADSAPVSRTQFTTAGSLTNSVNDGPNAINGSDFEVFAISEDLGTVKETPRPLAWAIALARDPAIQYITASGTVELRSPYWRAKGSASSLIPSYLQNYESALDRAIALDELLAASAVKISPRLVDLVSLSARQVMSATELTVGSSSFGYNTSDVKMFMKGVGPPGNARVNPVEFLYASFPFFLTVNATYCAWLLRPLLDYASSDTWNQSYAPADLGPGYPNATGSVPTPDQGVDQTGNMLVMTLAHAQATGDGSLIGEYYPLLQNWADYLVDTTWPLRTPQVTLEPSANSTNLALKGIIAIAAMSQISAANKRQQDADHYLSIAHSYVNSWTSHVLAPDQHIMLTFGQPDSWGLVYNMFSDKWLGTNLIDETVYASETAFLQNLFSTNNDYAESGIPIVNGDAHQDTAWALFTAMTMTAPSVRDSLIDSVWSVFSVNTTPTIFAELYTTWAPIPNDVYIYETAGSPKVGAMFAPLAMSIPNVSIVVPGLASTGSASSQRSQSTRQSQPLQSTSQGYGSNAALISGATIGAIAAVMLCLVVAVVIMRRRASRKPQANTKLDPFDHYLYDGDASERATSSTARWARKGRNAQLDRPTQLLTDSSAAEFHPNNDAGTIRLSNDRHVYQSGSGDVQDLRQELEDLRRVVQRFIEPPPTYHSDRVQAAW